MLPGVRRPNRLHPRPGHEFVNGDVCTLTVLASQVTDQDNNDPPDNMTVNFTASYSTGDACVRPHPHL